MCFVVRRQRVAEHGRCFQVELVILIISSPKKSEHRLRRFVCCHVLWLYSFLHNKCSNAFMNSQIQTVGKNDWAIEYFKVIQLIRRGCCRYLISKFDGFQSYAVLWSSILCRFLLYSVGTVVKEKSMEAQALLLTRHVMCHSLVAVHLSRVV